MLGRTHMVVGVAVSLAVLQPDTATELILGTGMAAVGGMISDIDVGTSESHKDADKIIGLAIAVVAVVALLDHFFDTGLIARIMMRHNAAENITGIAIILATCAFGKNQPHRSFMHSLLAMAILTGTIAMLLPMGAPYFAIAFLAHLLTDVLNRRKVRLWYPLPGGFSLNLFHAHGLANRIFFSVGSILSVLEIGWFLIRNILP